MSAPHTPQNGPKIKILVCTANMGNQQPDFESLNAWIPQDGAVENVLKNPKYPIHVKTGKSILKNAVLQLLQPSNKQGSSNNGKPPPLLSEQPNEVVPSSTSPWKRIDSTGSISSSDQLSFGDLDESDDFSEEESKGSLERFDIIVIGMQEATFVTESENKDGKNAILAHLKGAKDLATDKSHLQRAKKRQILVTNSLNATSRHQDPLSKSEHVLASEKTHTFRRSSSFSFEPVLSEPELNRFESGGTAVGNFDTDTDVLHDMLQTRLPTYTQAISYQRGQMRMMMFYNEDKITLDVISLKAQNTGKAGLANKGGIVTEVLVNGGTRIAFFTAHLEAHEGPSKYATRCSTVGDIFRGTVSSTTRCNVDASLASHFMFAMGDLNFRTRLPDFEPGSPEHVTMAHELAAKKEWLTLYNHDELCQALRKKHCFVGFSTPPCNFPPTFKVQRQSGYVYNEKRSPSYTDRILYKGSHRLRGKVKVLAYEPIDDFTTSDHKPLRGAFEVELNPRLKWRPTLSKRSDNQKALSNKRSMRIKKTLTRKPSKEPKRQDRREFLHLFASSISCTIKDEKYEDSSPSPFVSFISTPAEAIKKDTTRWEKFSKYVKNLATGKKNLSNLKNTEGTMVWPQTRPIRNTRDADWNNETVHFKVRTHYDDGMPVDLTGSMMHIAVFDSKGDQRLIGSFTLNLASLIVESRKRKEKNGDNQPEVTEVESTPKGGLAATMASIFSLGLGRSDNSSPFRFSVASADSSSGNGPPRRGRLTQGSLFARKDPVGNGVSHSYSLDDESKSEFIEKKKSADDKAVSVDENVLLDINENEETEVTYRPSSALLNCANPMWFQASGEKKWGGMGHRGSIAVDVHSMKINEPLMKNGMEVGRIRLTIDSWWLSDEAADDKKKKMDEGSNHSLSSLPSQ